MCYHDEKIDYSNYFQDKPLEMDLSKIAEMKEKLVHALQDRDVHGTIRPAYYADGRVLVSVDGKFYGVFDTSTGKFFSDSDGD